MVTRKDLTGKRFGNLLVICPEEDFITDSGKRYKMWKCLCDCGNTKITRESYLKNGFTKSCGCRNLSSRKWVKKNKNIVIKSEDETVFIKLSNCEDIMTCDKEDWEKYKSHTWYKNDKGYAVSRFGKHIKLFHKLCCPYGEKNMVDHIDRNKLNNTKDNLRITNYDQNNKNVNKRKNNTSGYKGVSKRKNSEKFETYVYINHKRKFLGYFDTAKEASEYRENYIKTINE